MTPSEVTTAALMKHKQEMKDENTGFKARYEEIISEMKMQNLNEMKMQNSLSYDYCV